MSENLQASSQASSEEKQLVVGIGASAGGIEAVSELLRHLPIDSEMAYVLVQHLSPDQPSQLSEILSRTTAMPVTQVEEGTVVEPNHIYVIPTNTEMTVVDGQLRLAQRDRTQSSFMPIDTFFRSLASAYGNRAVGVILSGLDGDGAQGIREIKGAGGITFAQCAASAQYSDMPNTAVATGQVDFILPPAEIAAELADISQHPYLNALSLADPEPEETREDLAQQDEEALSTIFALLRSTMGVDFRYYKRTTFERRLHRRMALRKLHEVRDYARYLEEHTNEIHALYQDALITVTSFFRDPEVFAHLQETVFPELLRDKTVDSSIRIWVPGCATGEECYSLAMSLLTFLAEQPIKPAIQIFGTDINEVVIDKARTGIYAESILADIPIDYRRFFVSTEGRFQVTKAVREQCIFARQDLMSDPPFSNIDLISCRNVLIYFTQALQKRIFSIFHYSLNPDGFLMLGSSESVGDSSSLFTIVDKNHRFYRRKTGPARLSLDFVTSDYRFPTLNSSPTQPIAEAQTRIALQHQADQVILNRYAPVGVVIDEALDIVQFRGDTSPYLRPPSGVPSFNLLKMLRPNLLQETRMAVMQAKEQNIAVKREGLSLEGQTAEQISLEVLPLNHPSSQERCYLVLFEPETAVSDPLPDLPAAETQRDPADLAQELAQLQRELATARQELQDNQLYLQATVEDQESTNQRLMAANEEILSSNEELQSTNEELQTAKEEIQAANEELKTTNEELQSRNIEARRVNDDLLNLLNNVNLPILMLSNDLRIRRFTPSAQQLFNLIPADKGRPLNNIRLNLEIEVSQLEGMILLVIETLETQAQEVQDSEGRWYSLRIRPYRTIDNRIDGAVMVLLDINDLKQTLARLDQSRHNAESLVESMPIPLLVLNENLRVQKANHAFYEMFERSQAETEQQLIFELGDGEWDSLRSLLEDMLPNASQIENFEVEYTFERIGYRAMLLNAREIVGPKAGRLILLAIEDITDRKQAEAVRLQAAQDQAELAEAENASKDEFLSMLSHELRTPLNSILGWLSIIMHQPTDQSLLMRGLRVIRRSAQAQARLIEDLLDTSLIIQSRLELDYHAVDLTEVIQGVVDVMLPLAESKGVYLRASLAESPNYLVLDQDRIRQVVWNLISNAIKFTPEAGQVEISLTYETHQARIEVKDTGEGISPEFMPQVFNRFEQGSRSTTRQHGGLGLGLAIARYLVAAHNGTITAHSPGVGLGATFTVTLPLVEATIPPQEERAEELAVESEVILTGVRLLIVEDNVDNLEMLEVLCAQVHNATVVCANSVAEAIAHFTAHPPDLLVSDISLPDRDGFELIEWVRSLPSEQGGLVPAIAVTGHASERDAQRFIQAGFQAHVPKPVQFDQLLAVIITLIRT